MLLFILVEEDEHEVEETLDLRREEDKEGKDQDREDTEKNGNQDCVAIEMQGKLYVIWKIISIH